MAGARAGSAPPGPRDSGALGPRRSLSVGGIVSPRPRLRPLFLWVRQEETSVLQVHCEDYDLSNRLRLTRTPLGWKVLPRTETFDAIILPRAPPPPVPRRNRTKRQARPSQRHPQPRTIDRTPPARLHRPSLSSKGLQSGKHLVDTEEELSRSLQEDIDAENVDNVIDNSEEKENTWSLPDIEISIPSHTIHVPQRLDVQNRFVTDTGDTPISECEFNPTPLDNLLAVAELEFNQQQTADPDDNNIVEDTSPSERAVDVQYSKYQFISDACQGELSSFSTAISQEENIQCGQQDRIQSSEDDAAFEGGIASAKDLFESITDSHYIPMDLVDTQNQDEAINANELLDSLVEKGCEDNHIIDNVFDKIAQIVNEEEQIDGDYEDDEEMLMDDAPVSDIINRLEESLDSPTQQSIAAAQGLLHLQGMAEEMTQITLTQDDERKIEDYNNEVNEINTMNVDQRPVNDLNEIERIPNNSDNIENVLVNHNHDIETNIMLSEEGLLNEGMNIDNVTSNEHNDEDIENELIDNCERESEGYSSESEIPDTTKEIDSSVMEDSHIVRDSNIQICQSDKENDNHDFDEDLIPTDLSLNVSDIDKTILEEFPRDLTCRKRPASPYRSPRRVETPRPLSRGSDTVQSPQPSGIPAVPSSPELMPSSSNKCNKSIFLESLLSSPSPKMCFSSELTITKHQNEPLNLGKSRKSASPTVSSCSEEVKKSREIADDDKEYKDICDEAPLEKLNKLFSKTTNPSCENKQRKQNMMNSSRYSDASPVEQLQLLRCSTEFDLPDPLLIPKEKFSSILMSPAKEIPGLLQLRPELRIPEAFAVPSVLQDPDILVVSVSQLETILQKHQMTLEKDKHKEKQTKPSTPCAPNSTTESKKSRLTPVSTSSENSNRSLIMGSAADGMAGDIDAATQAALGQMLWLPYLSQFEAAVACSQNADLFKALHSPVQSSFPQQPGYPDLSQMFLAQARFMNPAAFSGMPPLDYNNPLELAMWQDAMIHNNNANMLHKSNKTSPESALLKSIETHNFVAQAAKIQQYQQQTRGHSARTSPVTRGYRSGSISSVGSMGSLPSPGVAPLPSLPWMAYPTRPSMAPLGPPQYSPGARSRHQQPTPSLSMFYQNNNYLSLNKDSSREKPTKEHATSSQQHHQKPRISVKSLQNLLEPPGEVVSSTHPPEEIPVSHESQAPLWHPLFGNQKTYSSPWNWTTVTVNGD